MIQINIKQLIVLSFLIPSLHLLDNRLSESGVSLPDDKSKPERAERAS